MSIALLVLGVGEGEMGGVEEVAVEIEVSESRPGMTWGAP